MVRRSCFPALLCFFLLLSKAVMADIPPLHVQAPFLELRSGPGRGFPVVYTLRRDSHVVIVRRKTAWLLLKAEGGREGWIHENQITALAGKEQDVELAVVSHEQFGSRQWELGLIQGEADSRQSDSTPLLSIYGSYYFTENLSAELQVMQIISDYSESLSGQINISHQLAPDWLLSPFLSVGYGRIKTDPKTTLGDNRSETNDAVNWSLGVRYHLKRRFFLRADYSQYLLLTQREQLDKVKTWKLGAGVFF